MLASAFLNLGFIMGCKILLTVGWASSKAKYMASEQSRDPGGVDRLSYSPMHDYRTVDVDAWAEQWFAPFVDLDPESHEYQDFEQVIQAQMALHPDCREVDADDTKLGMAVLWLLGKQNPHDANAQSGEDRLRHEQWQRDWRLARLISRQIVRSTLEGAERYAAFRVGQEQLGIDYLAGVLNRRGLEDHLREQYGITDEPMRRDPHGKPLPAIKLTLLYADANKFKWMNRVLGHQVGDAAIIETAWRAKDFLRQEESPIIYRHGGDEFGAILGGLGDYETEQLTKRVMDRQFDRVLNPEFRFRESMDAVEEALRAAEASGKRVRADARQSELTHADIVLGKRPHYVLYINGQPITELRNILILSVGVSSAMVSTLSGVEQLRSDAEAKMERVKPILTDIMEGKITARPDEF